MTIATTRTREMDIGKICLRAYQKAGLRNEAQALSEAQLSFARDTLGSIIDGLQAEGLRARAVEFQTVTLVAGTWQYTMPADVLDVVGVAMFIDPSETDITQASGEIALVPISREEWQLQPAKDATGRPLTYYSHRAESPLEVRLWPIPDAANAGTIRFQVHRLAADSNNSSNTMDLERFFSQYIEWEMTHQVAMANSLNMGRVQYFGTIARQKLEACKSYAAQKTPARLVIGHSTGWSRR
jgi:hypothetical protein